MIFYYFVSTEIALERMNIPVPCAVRRANILFWAGGFPALPRFQDKKGREGNLRLHAGLRQRGLQWLPRLISILGPDRNIPGNLQHTFNLLSYSLGIALVSDKTGGRRFNFKLWLNTPMIVSVISLAVFLLE
jgi:hypothetical protein